MRKLLLLCLPLLLLLAACGAETAVTEVAPAPESVDTRESTAPEAAEEEAVDEAPEEAPPGASDKSSVNTGSTVEEAGAARPEDHTKGSSDPTVTIIEYGDFQ